MSQDSWKLAAGELAEKSGRLQRFMEKHEAAGVLLRKTQNLFWATAGIADVRLLGPAETGVGSLLVLRDGRRFFLSGNNEAARLAEEEFDGSGYEQVSWPWQKDALAERVESLAKGVVLADVAGGAVKLAEPQSLAELQSPLTGGELNRFRELGKLAAEAVAEVLAELEPGMTEVAMKARMAAACLSRDLQPSVLLIAADERVMRYRHAVTRDGVLRRYGMLNLCARRWGLCVSLTRYVHFGALPGELTERFAAVAKVQAALYDASRPGASSAELYRTVSEAYAAVGFPGEENHHHQGGAAGYGERIWVAQPDGEQKLENGLALAWNPSIQGAKVEDTVLLVGGRIEPITQTLTLPVVHTTVNGKAYASAGVLLR